MKKIASLAAAAALAGCASGSALAPITAVTGSAVAADGAAAAAGASPAALPVDDYRYTTSGPKKTYVYACQSFFGGGGPSQSLPWVNAGGTTWNYNAKPHVQGSVTWTSDFTAAAHGSERTIAGNGLPNHKTGIFPISASDPVYTYDQNPSRIAAQTLSYRIPARPKPATKPSCANMGTIGVMITGAQLFNAFDAQGRDAAVHEVLDSCWGHPQQQGAYHYHTYSACMGDTAAGHSKLLGYALDGFGIFGPRGQDGSVLTSNQLDECHGHTHAILWNGKRTSMYHYHFTYDFPYSLGCYRGTPAG